MARYLAIDFGEKRIGLAVSDPTFTIAQPHATLQVSAFTKVLAALQKVILEMEISKIVIGLPMTLKGTDSQQTQRTRDFAEKLRARLTVPIELFDERLTTIQATQTLRMLGKKASRERDRIDQFAAMHLLQAYLDRERGRRNRNE